MKERSNLNFTFNIFAWLVIQLASSMSFGQSQSVPFPQRFVQCEEVAYTANDKEGTRFVFVTLAPEYVYDEAIENPLQKIKKFNVLSAKERDESEYGGFITLESEIHPMKVSNYTVIGVAVSEDGSQTYPVEYLVELSVDSKSYSSARTLYTRCRIGQIGIIN
jgi:hypothetical protein